MVYLKMLKNTHYNVMLTWGTKTSFDLRPHIIHAQNIMKKLIGGETCKLFVITSGHKQCTFNSRGMSKEVEQEPPIPADKEYLTSVFFFFFRCIFLCIYIYILYICIYIYILCIRPHIAEEILKIYFKIYRFNFLLFGSLSFYF